MGLSIGAKLATHKRLMRRKILAGLILAALTLAVIPVARGNITIQFDYTYDTGNFFGTHPQAQTLLNDAAAFFSSHITDSLSAIDPAAQSAIDHGSDTWQTNTFNPADPGNSSANIKADNLTIAANTILVYVGGATSMPGGELGLGGFGGFQDSGFSQAWFDTVQARGQSGALAGTPTDFGPWGGSISFSSTATWYFDNDPFTNDVPGGQNDFYSVALHELGHVLGIGTAASWQVLISGGNLTGAHSEALNGGNPVPLDVGLGHWVEGTQSDIYLTTTDQEAAMDPTLIVGTRKYFTALDMAGLQDVGWQVVPEPTAWPWLAGLAVLGAPAWRRKKFCRSRLSQHPGAGAV